MSNGDVEDVRKAQRDRLALYEDDIVKHSGPVGDPVSRRNLKKDGGFVNIPLYLAERFVACLG